MVRGEIAGAIYKRTTQGSLLPRDRVACFSKAGGKDEIKRVWAFVIRELGEAIRNELFIIK
jgi:hypothetical protein